ncbi:hypothetical protein D3C76_1063060 [compost metagenome]
MRDDQATERRAQYGCHQAGPGDHRQHFHQVLLLGRAQHHQPPHRHHQGTANALKHSGGDEGFQGRGHAAQQRRHGEQADGPGKYLSRSETVGHPATERNEYRNCQQIGTDADVQADSAFTEVTGHLRQCRGNHGGVEVFHEEGDSHQQGDAGGLAGGVDGCRVGQSFRSF